jgi:hypothetical protein
MPTFARFTFDAFSGDCRLKSDHRFTALDWRIRAAGSDAAGFEKTLRCVGAREPIESEPTKTMRSPFIAIASAFGCFWVHRVDIPIGKDKIDRGAFGDMLGANHWSDKKSDEPEAQVAGRSKCFHITQFFCRGSYQLSVQNLHINVDLTGLTLCRSSDVIGWRYAILDAHD